MTPLCRGSTLTTGHLVGFLPLCCKTSHPMFPSNRCIWSRVVLQSYAAQAPAVTLLSPLNRIDAVRVSQLLLSAKVWPPLLLR